MPRIWTDTVDAHRVQVRRAILTSTWHLVMTEGLFAVTMSRVAEATGIGRATLYKYFPNVESILAAHHLHHVEEHLDRLERLAAEPGQPIDRLATVFTAWAEICQRRQEHGTDELSSLLHRDPAVAEAEQRVKQLFAGVLTDAIAAYAIRDDVAVDDLADYCVRALTAVPGSASPETRSTLVEMTINGLRR